MGNADLGTMSTDEDVGRKPRLRVARVEQSCAGREKWPRRKRAKEKNVAGARGGEDQATRSLWPSPVISSKTAIEYLACLFSMVGFKTQLLLPILS